MQLIIKLQSVGFTQNDFFFVYENPEKCNFPFDYDIFVISNIVWLDEKS